MKRFLLAFFCMIVSVFAFSQWIQTSGIPYARECDEVYFLNKDTGFIVGTIFNGYYYFGEIWKTTNGGNNWKEYPVNAPELYSLYFTDYNTGYVCGNSGYIGKTTNSGMSWQQLIANTSPSLQSITFSSPEIGFAVGFPYYGNNSKVFKTTNGGSNWLTIDCGISQGLLDVFCIDNDTAFAVGSYGTIIKTTNGGINWESQTSGTNANLFSVFYTDASNGYIAGGWLEGGGNIILKTTNSGKNWFNLYTNPSGMLLYSVHFINSETGYVVGWNGVILKTTNGGTNWTSQEGGSTTNLTSVYFTDSKIGYSVGSAKCLKTTNGGAGFFEANQSQASLFMIYPNPATDKICITNSALNHKETIVDLFNIHGELLLSSSFSNQNTLEIDVSSLAKGVYIIKIQAGDGFETKKLVIQ